VVGVAVLGKGLGMLVGHAIRLQKGEGSSDIGPSLCKRRGSVAASAAAYLETTLAIVQSSLREQQARQQQQRQRR
jgi:hypothetical protein